eukprot:6187141-Pleurochrysis_carterae.AAC.5
MLCSRPPPSTSALSTQSDEIPYRANQAESPSGREKGPENNSRTRCAFGGSLANEPRNVCGAAERRQRQRLTATAVLAADPNLRRRVVRAS